ncbi:hypothetical protein V5799_019724 [Amblyomma americanum]|uniref:Uncharacterized protein n=1 Tax=Amblyomma americanum TaxID=6943 RepID=A0AAQ4EWH0_AMBAM
MKAWTGGLGQLERFLENSCSRSTDPAPTDMFPGFPSSGSSQAMPGSAPLNPSAAANPWFHQSPFSMAADIHSGTSGPAPSSMTGSPYWLPHQQYTPAPTDPHQSRYSAGNDLYSASAASPWWFGHGTAASAGSGLHSSQYFPQHVTRNDHMSNPFHTSTTPSKPGYLQHGLATAQHLQQQQSMPSPAQHLHQSAVQQPTYHSPATSQHEAMSSPAPIQPIPSSQHQSIGISSQHQRSLMSPSSQQLSSPASMMAQHDGMLSRLVCPCPVCRDIKNETELDEVTLNAQKEEQERMKRLQEARMRALQSQNLSGGPVPPAAVAPIALGSSSSSEDEDSASQSASEDEAAVPRRAGERPELSLLNRII